MRYVLHLLLVLLAAMAAPAAATAQTRGDAQGFADWAAVVVAADWRAANGAEAPIFDNARRDVVSGLTQLGFAPGNIVQLSSASQTELGVEPASVETFVQGAEDVTRRAQGGCLFYLTSHGAPQGIVFGRQGGMTPETLAGLVDRWCGRRPTVVVVSACYSGVFVPVLEADNRMVLTAARPDRTSFGCGNTNRYPYFDECVISTLPSASDFLALARAATTCVAAREAAEGLTPPSEPQTSIGREVRPILERLTFAPGRTAPAASADDAGPAAALGKPPQGKAVTRPSPSAAGAR